MKEVILICRGNQTNQSKKKETESCLRAENETEQHLIFKCTWNWYIGALGCNTLKKRPGGNVSLNLDDSVRDVKELALSTTKTIFLTLGEKFTW